TITELFQPLAASKPCRTDGECETGSCVDGTCCDTRCSDPCVACSAKKKGAESMGCAVLCRQARHIRTARYSPRRRAGGRARAMGPVLAVYKHLASPVDRTPATTECSRGRAAAAEASALRP